MTLALACGGILGATLVARRYTARLELHRELFEFMGSVGAGAIDQRVPDELEAQVGSGLNRLLDSISWQYKTAERRGLEWEKAVDAIDDVVCVLDSRGRIVRANRALAARIGCDIRQIRGMRIEELLYPDQESAERGPIASTKRTRRAATGFIPSCPIGKNLTLVTAPVRRDYGESMICLGIRDPRNEAPEEARARHLGQLVGSLPVPLVLASAVDGKVSYVNPAFRSAFGYGDLDLDKDTLNLDDLPLAREESARLSIRMAAHDETGRAIAATLRMKDGTPIETRVTGALRRTEAKRPQWIVLMIEPVARETRVASPPAASRPSAPGPSAAKPEASEPPSMKSA